MRLLLDTHTFLWFIGGDLQLSPTCRALIEDVNNERLLSIASVWEMAIKVGLGKLPLAQPLEVLVPEQIRRNAMDLLPIETGHTFLVARLPMHHRDPFDRLLAAQSLAERVPLLSADAVFDNYGVQRIW
jgi:PIN domain nuclease of toxin-antitoxin system